MAQKEDLEKQIRKLYTLINDLRERRGLTESLIEKERLEPQNQGPNKKPRPFS